MLGSKATWRGNELLGLQVKVYHEEKQRLSLEAGTEVEKEYSSLVSFLWFAHQPFLYGPGYLK